MDGKSVVYSETAMDKLAQVLRSSGQPQDITWLTERYIELLREMVVSKEANTND